MNIELKPCPFCGGEAEMMGDQYPYVECQECAGGFTANHSYDADENDAASKWNARSAAGPNIKPIAESKVRQLGGDVCGVLVRKDEKLAAVDEHGRVRWLDSWGEAARAQGGQGAEVVAWSWDYRGLHVSTDKAFVEKIAADGFVVRPLVFADTQPAQQGSAPVAFRAESEDGVHFAGTKEGAIEEALAYGLEVIDVEPLYTHPSTKVPAEPTEEMLEAAMSERDKQHPANAKRYLRYVWGKMLSATPTPATTPQTDGWIRCEDRSPTEADADCFNQVWLTDVSGDGVQMEPWQVDWSFVTKGSGHWMPTGLKRPQPPKEGE